MSGPLTGRTIIEVAHMLAGPYCGMLLADLGAEVIKVESPEGDIARRVSPHAVGAHNSYFASLNRGKKSVVLNLGRPEDRAAFHRLTAISDGLITNLRPSAIRKLGLTYEALRSHNPRLACLALTGYGLEGPFADSPAYDYVIQALTGVMQMTGDPGMPPVKLGYSAVDNSAGIMGALALVSNLLAGKGGQIDVSMYETMLSQLNYIASGYLNAGEEPKRITGGGHPYIVPAQIFPARSGYVVLFITHDKFWRIFAEDLGESAWLTDERFSTMAGRSANREMVTDAIARRLAERDAGEWVERLAPQGLVIAAIQSLSDALESRLVASRGMVIEIPIDRETLRLVGSPIRMDGMVPQYVRPPLLGEHNGLLYAEGGSVE